jgi:hypothetical protein
MSIKESQDRAAEELARSLIKPRSSTSSRRDPRAYATVVPSRWSAASA